jgi:hypothetical protein
MDEKIQYKSSPWEDNDVSLGECLSFRRVTDKEFLSSVIIVVNIK